MDAAVRLVFLLVAIGVGIYRWRKGPAWKRAWARAAERLGLEADGFRVEGWLEDRYSVVVTREKVSTGNGNSALFTQVVIGGGGIASDVTIGPEGFFSRNFGKDDIAIGHKPADDKLRVVGDEATALAVLSAPAREAMLAHKSTWTVDGGSTTVRFQGVLDADALVAAVEQVAAFADAHLRIDPSQPELTVAGRLANNVATDPESGVRRRNLEVLLDAVGGQVPDGALVEALRPALDDDDENTRVLAAIALRGCAGVGPRAQAAVDAALGRVLVLDGRVAARLADVAAEAGREDVLLALLDHGDDAAKQAAMARLEADGSLAAVEPLLQHASRWFGGGLAQRAKQAIAAIQARAAGSGARGGMSLVDADWGEGGLSVSAGEGEGALALETVDAAAAVSVSEQVEVEPA